MQQTPLCNCKRHLEDYDYLKKWSRNEGKDPLTFEGPEGSESCITARQPLAPRVMCLTFKPATAGYRPTPTSPAACRCSPGRTPDSDIGRRVSPPTSTATRRHPAACCSAGPHCRATTPASHNRLPAYTERTRADG